MSFRSKKFVFLCLMSLMTTSALTIAAQDVGNADDCMSNADCIGDGLVCVTAVDITTNRNTDRRCELEFLCGTTIPAENIRFTCDQLVFLHTRTNLANTTNTNHRDNDWIIMILPIPITVTCLIGIAVRYFGVDVRGLATREYIEGDIEA